MNLRREFTVAASAGEAFIRVNTDEVYDALATLQAACADAGTGKAPRYNWELRVWDSLQGVKYLHNKPETSGSSSSRPPPSNNALSSLNQSGPPTLASELVKFYNEPPRVDVTGEVTTVVFVATNFHQHLRHNSELLSATLQHLVRDQIQDLPNFQQFAAQLRTRKIDPGLPPGKIVVALMPAEAVLPLELAALAKVIEHELPDIEELRTILASVVTPDTVAMSDDVRERICLFARGLTRLQAEGVFASGLSLHGSSPEAAKLLAKYVWEQKSKILNKEGLVTLYEGTETFADIVGLEGLKALLKDLLTSTDDANDPELRSRGLAVVGSPRTGKSLTAKACGNELGLPTLLVDVGRWFGGLVGATEMNTRRGFQIIRAHAPCVAILDSN